MTKIYIAGPMTGLPQFNYPAFHAAAAELRAQGMEVFNPAEITPPVCGSWGGYMRQAIAQLVQCEAIFLLTGWQGSKGAMLENDIAEKLGMDRYRQSITMAEVDKHLQAVEAIDARCAPHMLTLPVVECADLAKLKAAMAKGHGKIQCMPGIANAAARLHQIAEPGQSTGG